jgi:hypothetical protein
MSDYPIIHDARILQIIPAPAVLSDDCGNIVAGYALCEFDLEWRDGERRRSREILPFGTEGGIRDAPGESYYQLHALGDDRPDFADVIFDREELRERERRGGAA